MATRFMPEWVLGFTCAYISLRFVNGTMPLQAFTNKYSKSLSEKYADASSKKLIGISQDMLYFLATFESSNHMAIVESYMFNSLNFTQRGKKRKIKTLFGSALDAQKQVTTHEASIRRFKNFVFQLRADSRYKAPAGWNLREEQGIEWLQDIYEQNIRPIDGF
ncbi:MAG: hypothetical protein RMX61_04025 [Planktomarina sp.]|nr:hypothetical protein [Planktomarina sp.]|tara:strand:- start:6 stop:494 length:489 start_codon:yes stop_codon:yes gene_type:complete